MGIQDSEDNPVFNLEASWRGWSYKKNWTTCQQPVENFTTREPSYFCMKEKGRMKAHYLFTKYFENPRIWGLWLHKINHFNNFTENDLQFTREELRCHDLSVDAVVTPGYTGGCFHDKTADTRVKSWLTFVSA